MINGDTNLKATNWYPSAPTVLTARALMLRKLAVDDAAATGGALGISRTKAALRDIERGTAIKAPPAEMFTAEAN